MNRYIKNYKKVKEMTLDKSGGKFCLTGAELQKGMTLEEKQYSLCPQYIRLDNLYGSRANVSPAFTMEPDVQNGDNENEWLGTNDYSDIEEYAVAYDAQLETTNVFSSSDLRPFANNDTMTVDQAGESMSSTAINTSTVSRVSSTPSTVSARRANQPTINPVLAALTAASAAEAAELGEVRLVKSQVW